MEISEEPFSEVKLENVNAIAKPMATKKLAKKVFKCIKKGM